MTPELITLRSEPAPTETTLASAAPTQSHKPPKPLSFSLIYIVSDDKNYPVNKDLNGGFGTADDYGNSITSRIIKAIKRKAVRFPVVGMAYLQAILKQQGHTVEYFEERLPDCHFDVMLIYGSIVDCAHENRACKQLKEQFPQSRIGIFGSFPSRNPHIFNNADFALLGEAESFFMNDFHGIKQLDGNVPVTTLTDLDALPSPDYSGFPLKKYRYAPAIMQKPFVMLAASRGCPYTCKYYCTYGEYQGPKIRARSPKKVADDILLLQQQHGIKGVQFRDPTFGLNKGYIEELCKEFKERNVKIAWGMETRLDILDKDK